MDHAELRCYLVSDGNIFAIWEVNQLQMLELLKKKPRFQIITPGGYPTRAEAEAERQRLQNSR